MDFFQLGSKYEHVYKCGEKLPKDWDTSTVTQKADRLFPFLIFSHSSYWRLPRYMQTHLVSYEKLWQTKTIQLYSALTLKRPGHFCAKDSRMVRDLAYLRSPWKFSGIGSEPTK